MNEEEIDQIPKTKLEQVEDCLIVMRDFLRMNPVDKAKIDAHSKKLPKNSRVFLSSPIFSRPDKREQS
jgi:hypothetical protein